MNGNKQMNENLQTQINKWKRRLAAVSKDVFGFELDKLHMNCYSKRIYLEGNKDLALYYFHFSKEFSKEKTMFL